MGFSTGGNEAIRINAVQQVGLAETNPTSTLDVNGSFATAAVQQGGGYSIAGSDHTVVITSIGLVNLPTASTVPGRILILKNSSGGIVQTNTPYNNTNGIPTVDVSGVVWLQSIAGNWEQIN
ncbi:hypothetical protein [Robiginitalea sediminis]|uniref:hypothetical protein n=1 Tax=Robiginitalea sediminis TaxID=1982593 RepID=UPI0011798FCD|nr:hypothetical protein [Robiginitalea sediminis]